MADRPTVGGSLRRVARSAIAVAPVDAGLAAVASTLERTTRAGPHALAVLTYHRVDEPGRRPDLYPGLISATPGDFEAHVAHLAARHTILSLDDLLEIRRGTGHLPERAAMITFDDAYRDLADVAWPILRRYRLPATVFVPTDFPDSASRFWWDRLWAALVDGPRGVEVETSIGTLRIGEPMATFREARARLKAAPHADAAAAVDRICQELDAAPPGPSVLGWGELRAMASEGLDVAAHTRTHALLTRIPSADLAGEIDGSIGDLREQLGAAAPAIAYPSGDFDDAVVDAVARAGCELAFTTLRGGNDTRTADWLRLRRINVGGATTLSAIRLQLLLAGRRAPALGRGT